MVKQIQPYVLQATSPSKTDAGQPLHKSVDQHRNKFMQRRCLPCDTRLASKSQYGDKTMSCVVSTLCSSQTPQANVGEEQQCRNRSGLCGSCGLVAAGKQSGRSGDTVCAGYWQALLNGWAARKFLRIIVTLHYGRGYGQFALSLKCNICAAL